LKVIRRKSPTFRFVPATPEDLLDFEKDLQRSLDVSYYASTTSEFLCMGKNKLALLSYIKSEKRTEVTDFILNPKFKNPAIEPLLAKILLEYLH